MDVKVLNRFRKLCSRQECCSKDIYSKALKALDGDCAAAEEIIASLKEEKYLDDRRYASAYARDKASLSGWGRVKIRFQLLGKGLAEEDITYGLGEIDEESSCGKMKAVIASKRKTLEGDPEIRLKLLKFALSRGYSYDEARSAVEETLK